MYKKLLICILFLAFFASNVTAAQINLTDKKNASTPGTYYFKDMVGDIDTNTTELYAGDAASVKLAEDNTLTGANIIGKLLNIILSDGSETMTSSTFAWTANRTWDFGDYDVQSVNESVVDVNGYVAPKITYQALPPTKDQDDGMYIAPIDTAQSRMYAKKSTGYTNISDGGFTFFAPEVESLNVNGTDLTIVFTEAMTQGSAWTEDLFTVDASVTGAGIGMDVDSGDTTDTWLATLDSAMVATDVVTFDFTGVADSVESSTGDDLAAINSLSVVNNTTGLLIDQNFETTTTGYDNGETWSEVTEDGGGSIDPAYTTTVLLGTQSCLLSSPGYQRDSITSADFTASSTITIRHMVRFTELPNSSARDHITFYDSADTLLGRVRVRDTGTVDIHQGTGVSYGSGAAFAINTTYYTWTDIVNSTGADDGSVEFYVSTSDTKPGTAYLSLADGTNTTDIEKISISVEDSMKAIIDAISVE